MSQLILEFTLPPEAVKLFDDGTLTLELGNGVRLTTTAPSWTGNILASKLQLVMEIDGNPPNAQSSKPSI